MQWEVGAGLLLTQDYAPVHTAQVVVEEVVNYDWIAIPSALLNRLSSIWLLPLS